ncbi:MAG TPA: hypothetical protein VF223_12830 [Trebonia sp.]
MIRRGFWLVVGAAGGIMGYRRVSSLGRQVSETLGARQARPGRQAHQARPRAAERHWARETIRFTRDVREGMDLYSVRQAAKRGPTLGSSEDPRY